jgi:hypothetical protein
MMRSRHRGLRPVWDQLDERCLLSGFTPPQLAHAYGLDAITFTSPSGSMVKGDGTGETIALVEAYHDPYLASDLHTFDQTYNLPDPMPRVLTLGAKVSNAGWALEESLDVEWAHALAPGANLLVVEARSQSRQNLLAAVDVARNTPGVVAVSMSWGFAEASYESSWHFTTPDGHPGITCLAPSGDNGLAAGAEWPATSPNVLSVGGTALILDGSGNYLTENVWAGSGGGLSRYAPEPNYQRVIQATGRRSTPDVAFDADPNTGVVVYQTSLLTGQGSWQIVGGTSLATPAWAAIIAIADQGRALAGEGSLDGPTQTLPILYSLPSTDFHTVAGSSPRGRGGSAAAANRATGLGSPNGPSIIADLAAATLTTPLTIRTGQGGGPHSTAAGSHKSHSPRGGGSRHHHHVEHSSARIDPSRAGARRLVSAADHSKLEVEQLGPPAPEPPPQRLVSAVDLGETAQALF